MEHGQPTTSGACSSPWQPAIHVTILRIMQICFKQYAYGSSVVFNFRIIHIFRTLIGVAMTSYFSSCYYTGVCHTEKELYHKKHKPSLTLMSYVKYGMFTCVVAMVTTGALRIVTLFTRRCVPLLLGSQRDLGGGQGLP